MRHGCSRHRLGGGERLRRCGGDREPQQRCGADNQGDDGVHGDSGASSRYRSEEGK